MGAPRRGKMAVHRAWRCRGGHADGIRHRRRSAAAAESRLCGARRFHPWLIRTTHALVHDRAAVGSGCKLRYVPGGAALTGTITETHRVAELIGREISGGAGPRHPKALPASSQTRPPPPAFF